MTSVTLDGRTDPESAALLVIDVGVHTLRSGFLGVGSAQMGHRPTLEHGERWSVERLGRIVAEVADSAIRAGLTPAQVVIAAPGLVDPIHGVVQHSPGLEWHDVAVAHELEAVTDCPVMVRERVRSAASAEGVLGVAGESPAGLFVSVDDDLGAALVQTGQVSPDLAQVGEIGAIRLRSGPSAGQRLDEVVTERAIGVRYSARLGSTTDPVGVADVLAARDTGDAGAIEVWDETVAALADALDWLVTLFTPELIVLGGEVGSLDARLTDQVAALLTEKSERRASPPIRAATFGADAAWVGAALTGWRRARWPLHALQSAVRRVISGAAEPPG